MVKVIQEHETYPLPRIVEVKIVILVILDVGDDKTYVHVVVIIAGTIL